VSPLGLILNVGAGLGYPLLFAVVAAEAGGLPLPGETALIAAGVAASGGRLEIAAVIPIAAAAAIAGDNVGYLLGRTLGRRVLIIPGPLAGQRRKALELGQPFFARYGGRAVFFGRWLTGVRTWASWLAGADGMRWRKFALWNAAGGISWATSVGLLAYVLGRSATNLVTFFGAFAGAALLGLLATLWLRRRLLRDSVARSAGIGTLRVSEDRRARPGSEGGPNRAARGRPEAREGDSISS